MQFAVPQFTDVEDRLIGPLTLKQFLIVLGFGGFIFFLWSITGGGIIFFLIAIPVAALGAYVTFKKLNGRPFFVYMLPLLSFLVSPRVMIFKREPHIIHFSSKEIKKPEVKKEVDPASLESADSRLRKLAYLLDQKTEEEKELIVRSQEMFGGQKTEGSAITPSPAVVTQRPGTEPQTRPAIPRIKTVNTLPQLQQEPKRKQFNPSDILQPHG
jgi:hypothetical protein